MDALRIKTLEEDNQFLLGQVQLLERRNRQLQERITEISVSFTSWTLVSLAAVVPPDPARVTFPSGNEL